MLACLSGIAAVFSIIIAAIIAGPRLSNAASHLASPIPVTGDVDDRVAALET